MLDACQQLKARLGPVRQSLKEAAVTAAGDHGVDHIEPSWVEVVNKAYVERVDLSAHGFYATPDITGRKGVVSGGHIGPGRVRWGERDV